MSDIHAQSLSAAGLLTRFLSLAGRHIGDREISISALSVYGMRLGGVAAAFILQVIVTKLIGIEVWRFRLCMGVGNHHWPVLLLRLQ